MVVVGEKQEKLGPSSTRGVNGGNRSQKYKRKLQKVKDPLRNICQLVSKCHGNHKTIKKKGCLGFGFLYGLSKYIINNVC